MLELDLGVEDDVRRDEIGRQQGCSTLSTESEMQQCLTI
jgi:hypothetical protein